MKQATFFKIAVATNICFLFLIVQKSSKSIQLSYDKQKLLNEKESLTHRQAELTHQLYACKSLSNVKQFAQKELCMKPCSIKQVKPLTLTSHVGCEADTSSLIQQKTVPSETQHLAQNKVSLHAHALNHIKPLASHE